MKPIHLAAAVLFATTPMAMAQEKVQISYSGILSVANTSGTSLEGDYFYGNGDVSFRWSTANNFKFGTDFGIETFDFLHIEDFIEFSSYYAAGVVEGRFGKMSIGMPRGVMEQYFNVHALGGSEFYDLAFLLIGTDFVKLLKLQTSEEMELYGVRYDGKIGKIEVAASTFKLSEAPVYIDEIVARYDTGQWSVSLGTSLLDVYGFSQRSSSIEVHGYAGKFSGGMVYNKLEAPTLPDLVRVFASYDINEMIKLNTQVTHYQIKGYSDSNIYSFDLTYKNKTGAFFNAGIIKSELSGDNIFDVSLGYKF